VTHFRDTRVLREHLARSGEVGLVFPSTASTPLNKANVRKRVRMPLLKRAQVPYRDIYSLHWTFVSLARARGETAFNVSRVIGHARSTILDTIYAHTVDSAVAGVSERVAERVGLTLPTPLAAPGPPTVSRQPPKLRVIEGGRRAEGNDQQDIRRTIDDARARSPRERRSDRNGGADGSSRALQFFEN
jgi:hypothetical protein